MSTARRNIKSLSLAEMTKAFVSLGLKQYCAGQVFPWLYQRGATTFEEMTNIAKSERGLLAERFTIPSLTLLQAEQSHDGTRKFLFGLEDGHTIESVSIPDEDRLTLCISSQVGCAQACRFCLTGKGGFTRNLAAWEIVDQALCAERLLAKEGSRGGNGRRRPRAHGRTITNIVLMGMGEPLANFDEVVKALGVITSGKGLGFSPRRVTLSTAGLVPAIKKLGRSGPRVNLAVSLNAATDAVRDRIMPVNRRWPLKELLAACREYPLEPRRRITFEYVLLRGVNDSEEDARRLVRLLHGITCKVNLIPYNPTPGSEFERPGEETVRRFQKVLLDHRITAPVRESRGRDISAACGQLRERAAGLTYQGSERNDGRKH